MRQIIKVNLLSAINQIYILISLFQSFFSRRYTLESISMLFRSFMFPVILISSPPKLMKTELYQLTFPINLHLLLVDVVLEDLPVHHVVVLVQQTAGLSLGALVHVGEDVELLGGVWREGGGYHHRVVSIFLHGVDVGVDIKLDFEFVDLALGLDSRDYS